MASGAKSKDLEVFRAFHWVDRKVQSVNEAIVKDLVGVGLLDSSELEVDAVVEMVSSFLSNLSLYLLFPASRFRLLEPCCFA